MACKQPCNRKLPCGHGCSELCSDRCRCGQQCKYVAEVLKKTGANFVTLDKFLGSEAEMSDDALTASVMGEDAADLISTWGDDVAVPSAVIGSVGAPRNDLAYLDSSGTDGERSRRSSGSGSDEYTSHEDSPATANCSSGYPIESPSLSGSASEDTGRVALSWSTWNPEVDDYKAKQATSGKGCRMGGMVVKGTWRKIRVGDNCRRERIGVHHSTDVHTPPEAMKSVCARSIPRYIGKPVVMVQEAAEDALIDVSEAPVYSVVAPASSQKYATNGVAWRNGDAFKYEALGLWEQVRVRADATAVTEGGNALSGAGATPPEEDTRSEISDLIKF